MTTSTGTGIAGHRELESATQGVIAAALTWAARDYGEPGEFEADAALSDAVAEYKSVIERSLGDDLAPTRNSSGSEFSRPDPVDVQAR